MGQADLDLRRMKDVLKAEGVILHATETCYGLAADIFNEKAVGKIYALKKMRRSKPVSIMVRNLVEARKYAKFNSKTALWSLAPGWIGTMVMSDRPLPIVSSVLMRATRPYPPLRKTQRSYCTVVSGDSTVRRALAFFHHLFVCRPTVS